MPTEGLRSGRLGIAWGLILFTLPDLPFIYNTYRPAAVSYISYLFVIDWQSAKGPASIRGGFLVAICFALGYATFLHADTQYVHEHRLQSAREYVKKLSCH